MKIIYTHCIPPSPFKLLNFFGTIIAKKKDEGNISDVNLNHEEIHTAQMRDYCTWLPLGGTIFYVCYLAFWIWNLIFHTKTAYKSIPYEKEAYYYEKAPNYLKKRQRFAEFKHQFSK